MSSRRFQSSYALAVALVLAACSPPSQNTPVSPEVDSGPSEEGSTSVDARHAPPPPPRDAGTAHPDAAADAATKPPADAGGGTGSDAGTVGSDAGTGGGSDAGGGGGGGPPPGGTVACYASGSPSAMCTLPTHCCFTNYSAQHDGTCTTDLCAYGTISCDGPEDCPSGQRCCAHANDDPDWGILGYSLACQTDACGAAPLNQELCHPTAASTAGTCSTAGARCVTAYGNDNDLPRVLYICM
ncbi:MAG TPA: hypothetical protein VF469_40215 [Kofleriaceae bacterium]